MAAREVLARRRLEKNRTRWKEGRLLYLKLCRLRNLSVSCYPNAMCPLEAIERERHSRFM
jgi:hypothetical protein